MVRLRAYGINEFCSFVRYEQSGTGYVLCLSPWLQKQPPSARSPCARHVPKEPAHTQSARRVHAGALHKRSRFRPRPCLLTGYHNRTGKLKSFQMGAWIDRATLSRRELRDDPVYALYDTAVQAAFSKATNLIAEYEGEPKPLDVPELDLIASNLLDSGMRRVACPEPLHLTLARPPSPRGHDSRVRCWPHGSG